MSIILAIDGGGTKTICCAFSKNGRRLSWGQGGPSNQILEDETIVTDSITRAITKCIRKLQTKKIRIISAGMSGVSPERKGAKKIAHIIKRIIPHSHVIVTWDAITSLFGAIPSGVGCLAIAGTGSVVIARNEKGRIVKVGGWGPAFNGEWGADQIAREALTAVAKTYDGRNKKTLLARYIAQEFGLRDLNEIIFKIYQKNISRSRIALISKLVTKAAQKGDKIARSILKNIARELAMAIITALKKANMLEKQVLVSYSGSIFETGELIFKPLMKYLKTNSSGKILFIAPVADPLYGAFIIAQEPCKSLFPRLI
jgi:N-acetylglucosamine kinase